MANIEFTEQEANSILQSIDFVGKNTGLYAPYLPIIQKMQAAFSAPKETPKEAPKEEAK